MGIRLLPLIFITSLLLLGLKLFDMAGGSSTFRDILLVAETTAKEEAGTDSTKKPATSGPEKQTRNEEKPSTKNNAKEEKPHEAQQGADDNAATPSEKTETDLKNDTAQFTPKELELLQNLTKRREELDARERDIAVQASVLQATAAKMEERAAELKKLEEEANVILKAYQEKEDGKIKSLVKIYENMKPKDAARIFEKMDMPVLLEVVSRMKETKTAPILANMEPKDAKEVTTQLAGRRRLPEPDNSYKN